MASRVLSLSCTERRAGRGLLVGSVLAMSNANPETTLILGTEYDAKLFRALREVLQGLGAVEIGSAWDLGGS